MEKCLHYSEGKWWSIWNSMPCQNRISAFWGMWSLLLLSQKSSQRGTWPKQAANQDIGRLRTQDTGERPREFLGWWGMEIPGGRQLEHLSLKAPEGIFFFFVRKWQWPYTCWTEIFSKKIKTTGKKFGVKRVIIRRKLSQKNETTPGKTKCTKEKLSQFTTSLVIIMSRYYEEGRRERYLYGGREV